MERKIITTGDGSKTIHMPDWNEQYHSTHGALQEALHVFIEMGLRFSLSRREVYTALDAAPKRDKNQPISILEYGLGTGLNAMLTAQYHTETSIHYTGIEAFPISKEEVNAMEYGSLLGDQNLYDRIHDTSWEFIHEIRPDFRLEKKQLSFDQIAYKDQYDIIYFDAFGPRVQPELWTESIFKGAFNALKVGGVLTTYCAQGQARRNMQAAGFTVERLPGPPGKREMLRATKSN